MKLFSLLPKRLIHLACNSPPPCPPPRGVVVIGEGGNRIGFPPGFDARAYPLNPFRTMWFTLAHVNHLASHRN